MKPVKITRKRLALLRFLHDGRHATRPRSKIKAPAVELQALHDSGLIVAYTVKIIHTTGVIEETPEVSLTPIGKLVVKAYRMGVKERDEA